MKTQIGSLSDEEKREKIKRNSVGIKIPEGFNGEKFMAKYKLTKHDFSDNGYGYLVCPSLPKLKASDLLDCVGEL